MRSARPTVCVASPRVKSPTDTWSFCRSDRRAPPSPPPPPHRSRLTCSTLRCRTHLVHADVPQGAAPGIPSRVSSGHALLAAPPGAAALRLFEFGLRDLLDRRAGGCSSLEHAHGDVEATQPFQA